MWWGKKCKMLFITNIFPIWTHSCKTQPCFLIFWKVLLNLVEVVDRLELSARCWAFLVGVVLTVVACIFFGFGGTGVPLLCRSPALKSLWLLLWICPLLSKEHLKLTRMTSPRCPAAAAHDHLCLLHLPLTPPPEHSLLCCHHFLCV